MVSQSESYTIWSWFEFRQFALWTNVLHLSSSSAIEFAVPHPFEDDAVSNGHGDGKEESPSVDHELGVMESSLVANCSYLVHIAGNGAPRRDGVVVDDEVFDFG